jgi:glycosyltransferase involved in cell wall biosynthesis
MNDLVDGASELDVRVYPLARPTRLTYATGLRSGMEQSLGRDDVVDIHGLWLYPSWAASAAARSHELPYLVWPHGAMAPSVRSHGRLRKAISGQLWHNGFLRAAAAWRVSTSQEAGWVTEAWPRAQVFLVPNGLEFDRLSTPASADAFRDSWLRGHRGPVLLALGRIAAIKGLDVAIDALAELTQLGFPDAVLCLVGPDSEGLTSALRVRASQLGVGERLIITGSMGGDGLRNAMAASDILLSPSYTESFGNGLVEGLAAGLPAVVAPGVALGAAIDAAGAGRVAERTGHAFAVACAALLGDPSAYQRSRTAAIDYASQYSWSAVLPQFVTMYESVLRNHAAQH